MSIEINKAFVQQFSNNLIQLAQQKGSRLQGTVMNKPVVGKSAHFDRLGATAAVLRTSRHGDTPQIDTPHSRRRVTMNDYEWADLIDSQDELRMLIDPRSAYAKAGAWALGRTMDDIIIAAATGNAVSIDSADAASNVALPSGQTVDEDFNTADSNLIVEKLIEAKRILMKNEVDMDEPLSGVVNASALASLLNESEVQSADFNTIRALVQGDVNTFMGFNFVRTERLSGTADGTDGDPVLCLFYPKSAIGLATGQDVAVRISERDDKSYSTQVYAKMTCGATRVEDEKVVSVECVQSA
jgi:hypothetical protein